MGAIDAIVMIAHYLHIGEVGLEGTLQEDEYILFVINLLTLLLDLLLLNGELLDPIGNLIPNSREIFADLLVILQHHNVLVDSLEEAFPELLDLLSVYYVLPQQILSEVDQHPISIIR